MKRILFFLLALTLCLSAHAQKDTVYVSHLYTTHIVFSTPVTYLDFSNPDLIVGQIIEENKNMVAVMGWEPFGSTCSLSALESNGQLHTFIIAYRQSPDMLIVDTRPSRIRQGEGESSQGPAQAEAGGAQRKAGKAKGKVKGKDVSSLHYSNAPELVDIYGLQRNLYHLSSNQYGITVTCENIYAYSDITYIVLAMDNASGISYETETVSFAVEGKKRGKRTLDVNNKLNPKSKYGSLTAAAGGKAKIVYSFDKITLTRDQVLKVYVNEAGGQRELSLTLREKDINKAVQPF